MNEELTKFKSPKTIVSYIQLQKHEPFLLLSGGYKNLFSTEETY